MCLTGNQRDRKAHGIGVIGFYDSKFSQYTIYLDRIHILIKLENVDQRRLHRGMQLLAYMYNA